VAVWADSWQGFAGFFCRAKGVLVPWWLSRGKKSAAFPGSGAHKASIFGKILDGYTHA